MAELETQTQEATSPGDEVDEHAITRSVLGERWGHIRVVGRKIKGVGIEALLPLLPLHMPRLHLDPRHSVPVIKQSWLVL